MNSVNKRWRSMKIQKRIALPLILTLTIAYLQYGYTTPLDSGIVSVTSMETSGKHCMSGKLEAYKKRYVMPLI